MTVRNLAAFLLLACLLAGCTQQADPVEDPPVEPSQSEPAPTPEAETTPEPSAPNRDPPQQAASEPPADEAFVRIRDHIPTIQVDLRYATADNFTGEVIYDFSDAWLRYGTVCKLADAQERLLKLGYSLCIWDAFRPAEAQDRLWAVYPDGNYVANPANGYSGHTRGDTVDVTLLTETGEPVELPSGFDDFSARADRDYSDVSDTAAENARLLEQIMQDCGFSGYEKEWWHYSDATVYPPELEFAPPA